MFKVLGNNFIKNRVFLTISISLLVFIIIILLKDSLYSINENFKSVILKTKNKIELENYNSSKNIINRDIVVVTIDENTYNKFGFPFSRSKYATLIENLNKAGAAIIGFDIIFANENLLDTKGDDLLAEAIKKAGNVVLGTAIVSKDFDVNKYGVIESPLQKFKENGLGGGYYQPNVDPITNLTTSFTPSRLHYDDNQELKVFDHFSISVLKAYYSKLYNDPSILNYEKSDDKYYYLREDYKIPFSEKNKKYILINYIPLPNDNENKISRFPTYSFLDVYNGNIDPKVFEGKIVLVGATAKGLKDFFTTPNGIEYGVYVHANIINTILTKNYLFIFEEYLEFILIFALILLSVYFNLSRSGYVLLFSNLSIVIIFLIIFPLIILVGTDYLLNYIPELLIALVFSLIVSNIIKYLIENKDKNRLNEALSEYVSKDIANEILSGEGTINLNGERKKIAIYFSDIEGFTTISEKMQPYELVSFLREFLSNMSNIILDEKGFINKYEGDAIMALWGVFFEYSDCSSYYACSSAIKQQIFLKELNKKWLNEGLPEIKLRIGLHVGDAIVGNIGSKGRKMEFTALGDNVNLASRLEGVNKFYGTYICASEDVYNENKDRFIFRYLDIIRVKGKDKAVKIYELIGFENDIDNENLRIIKEFELGINFYSKKEFDKAIKIFDSLSKLGDRPSESYKIRCKNYIKNPPSEDWDGIWNMDSK